MAMVDDILDIGTRRLAGRSMEQGMDMSFDAGKKSVEAF